jgi:hypothetical protein
MKIIGETIHFRSIPFFYENEKKKDVKSNTVRRFDIEFLKYNFKYIAIHNSITGEYFIRKITSVFSYDGRTIFSWG